MKGGLLISSNSKNSRNLMFDGAALPLTGERGMAAEDLGFEGDALELARARKQK